MAHLLVLIPTLSLILSGLIIPVFAACPPTFPPPGYAIIPDNDVQVFVTYSETDRIETLVVQPTFSGTATEFGMVMPIPNRPEINEAPEDLFVFLETYTRQLLRTPPLESSFGLSTSSESSVVVIEQKDVGDFETTLLTAGNAKDLVDWLNSHNFQFTPQDESNFDYYVQKGGYYFVAMKVNMDEKDVDEEGNIDGKLRPIEFVFSSEHPMLPFRIMAHDMDPMSFTLYTLTEFPYYIPGVDIIFKGQLQEKKYGYGEALDKYEPTNKWLIRMNVEFDPRAIEKNLLLQRADSLGDAVSIPDRIKINPHLLPSDAGVIKGEAKENFVIANFVDTMTPHEQANYGIPPESIECKNTLQLMLRSDGQNSSCMKESSVSSLTERGWKISSMKTDELERMS